MIIEKPWEIIKEQLVSPDPEVIKEFLEEMRSEDVAGIISHLEKEERVQLLHVLKPEEAAELIDEIPWQQAVKILEDMDAQETAAILQEMPSDDQADFLAEFETANQNAVLDEWQPDAVEEVKKLIQYDDHSAGGLMITEFLAFDESLTVGEVVKNLSDHAEKYERYNLQYIYVTSHDKFEGVLQMRDLLLRKRSTPLTDIVLRDAITVNDDDNLDELISFFDTHDFYGVPVVNQKRDLLGVVLRKDLREAETEQINYEHLETQGIVGGEELRTLPILTRAKRRLSWLSVNILLNIAAASVIAVYQDTLSAVIALAVFLPIISDMSGCSGNQAVAVSLRELSLGVIKPFELVRVLWQEASVGLINGLVLGTLIGLAAWIWKGNIYLGLVVGGALGINTLIAVSLGGAIPLILKRFNVDPALASGPLLTTITDMLGFFLALTFASTLMPHL
ncbi:MAG: magnesium transporter [Cytophagales bacterium]|nr:magnesium transporter [Cytophagales bacterium]